MDRSRMIPVLFLFAGCAPLSEWKDWDPSLEKQIEKHREGYQTERKQEDIRWLLSNAVEQGMTLDQVNHILGEDGAHEHNDRRFRGNNENFRIDDEFFRFGPDAQGRNYYLAFREKRLVNFNPREFE